MLKVLKFGARPWRTRSSMKIKSIVEADLPPGRRRLGGGEALF